MEDIRTVLDQFRDDFITGAMYSALSQSVGYILSPDTQPIDTTQFALRAANNGFLFATSPMVFNISCVLVRPKLRPIYRVVPFVVTTSIITTAILQTVRTAMDNWYMTGRVSLRNWSRDFARTAASDAGFRVASIVGQSVLPPAHEMGGTFARSTALLTICDLGSELCAAPFTTGSLFGGFQRWLRSVPYSIYSNCLMVGVHSAIGT